MSDPVMDDFLDRAAELCAAADKYDDLAKIIGAVRRAATVLGNNIIREAVPPPPGHVSKFSRS